MERSDQRKVLGWGQGTLVKGELTRINQPRPLEKSWRVESFLGSGFSAGVFAAEDQQSGQGVVLRICKLPSKLKVMTRDLLHRQAWGLPFPYTYLEYPHLIAEGWDDILSQAVNLEGITRVSFPRSFGHFYDPKQQSFVSVHQRVYPERSLPPIADSQGERDYLLKVQKIKEIFELAKRLGAIDLARQWDLSTLHAITNGVIVVNPESVRECSLLDSRPGLPILAGLPLSPGDLVRALNLTRVDRPYFDQVDFSKLNNYFAGRSFELRELRLTLDRMQNAQEKYRDCLPKPISLWRYKDSRRRKLIRETTAQAFLGSGCVDSVVASKIEGSDLAAGVNLLLHNSSEAGPVIQKLLFNQDFREQLRSCPQRLLTYLRERRRLWLTGMIQGSHCQGETSKEVNEELLRQTAEDRVDRHLSDLLLTTMGVKAVAIPVSLALAKIGIDTDNYWLAAYSLGQLTPGPQSLVSFASIMRALYMLGRTIEDRLTQTSKHLLPLWADIVLIAASGTSFLGNLVVPVRMIGEYPVLSGVIISHYLDKVVRRIPIFGGPGSIPERWLYQLSYNWLARRINGGLPSKVERATSAVDQSTPKTGDNK